VPAIYLLVARTIARTQPSGSGGGCGRTVRLAPHWVVRQTSQRRVPFGIEHNRRAGRFSGTQTAVRSFVAWEGQRVTQRKCEDQGAWGKSRPEDVSLSRLRAFGVQTTIDCLAPASTRRTRDRCESLQDAAQMLEGRFPAWIRSWSANERRARRIHRNRTTSSSLRLAPSASGRRPGGLLRCEGRSIAEG